MGYALFGAGIRRIWRGVGVAFAVAFTAVGCTSLQSTQRPPAELRDGIRDGSLVQPGDEVGVVVADGREYVLVVREVDQEVLRGEQVAGGDLTVAIDDVLALRTHRTDEVRTVFAVVGGIGAAYIGILVLGLLLLVTL